MHPIEKMENDLDDPSPEALWRDAMRWRALMRCDRISATGSCPSPHGGLPDYSRGVSLQIWSHAPVTQNYMGRSELIELADFMRQCLGTGE